MLETIWLCKKNELRLIKNVMKKYVYKSYLIYIYKEDLALNNLQWLIAINPNQPINQP